MTLYRSLGNAIGTIEALDLAHRLAAWHDRMVVHQRRAGASPGGNCGTDCPHGEAQSLWLEAVDTYGDRAHHLGFLRGHAGGRHRGHRAEYRGSFRAGASLEPSP